MPYSSKVFNDATDLISCLQIIKKEEIIATIKKIILKKIVRTNFLPTPFLPINLSPTFSEFYSI